jgi:hypothetical protein
MENETETIDSTNDEVIEEETTNSTNSDEGGDDETNEYTPREKQLYARAKKAEADAKAAKAQLGHTETKAGGNDFGYDVKAYLKASGIRAEEFDFVKAEMKASGIADVDTLLENDYFKSKLEKRREVAKTQDAVPSGKRSGGVATDNVDYWLSKPIEEVPANMRRAVVNARVEREGKKSQFYNS